MCILIVGCFIRVLQHGNLAVKLSDTSTVPGEMLLFVWMTLSFTSRANRGASHQDIKTD